MKANALLVAALLGGASVVAEKVAKMDVMMELKTKQWDRAAEMGLFGGSKMYPKQTKPVSCVDSKAGEYQCNNIDMISFLSHEDLGSETLRGNDVWGWTSAEGREFGIVGQTDGVGFVEISKKGSLEYLGRLDTYTTNVSWRDIKVIGSHAYVSLYPPKHISQQQWLPPDTHWDPFPRSNR